MGSKGGSSGGQTTTSTSGPPPEVLAAYNSLISQGQQVASTPYTPYTGQTTAQLTDLQNQGLQGITNAQGTAQPYINQASTLANQSAQPLAQNLPQYNSQNLQQYQDPYQQSVINATQANLNQNNAVQQQQLLGHAISSGASPFGGDRAGVAAAELARNQDLANNQTIAGLQSQGFQNAQNEFNTQQQTQLSAQNSDANRQAQAASIQGGLGLASQSAALQGAEAQVQGGTLQQQTNQAGLTSAYNQFQQQQAFPYAQTGWLGNLVEGLGSNSGGTSSTTTPGASSASQAAGIGMLGLGAGSLFGGFKDGGSIHYASGGNSPYDVSTWIPEGTLKIGHSIPNAPQATKSSDPSLSGLGGLMSSMSGKSGSKGGMGNLFSQLGLPAGSSVPGSADAGGFDQNSMPWLGDMGGSSDMGSSMDWLSGGSDAASGAGDMASIGEDAAEFAKDGGSIHYASGGSPGLGNILAGNDQGSDYLKLGMQLLPILLAKDGGAIKRNGGGLIPHYDDGGDVDPNMDDTGDTYEVASEDIPMLGATMASNIPQIPGVAGSQDITPANNPGLSVASQNPQVETGQKPSVGQALVMAGLGTLAGNSPNALQNIAKGGLEGISNYGQQKQSILAAQKEKQLEQHQQSMDNKPQIITSGDEIQFFYPNEINPATGKKGLAIPSGIPSSAAGINKARIELYNAQAEKAKSAGEAGKFSMLPGTGQDENGNSVQGSYIFDAKTGESTFKPGVVTTGKGNKDASITPPGMTPTEAKEQAKTDAKRIQAYNANRPYIANTMTLLDDIDSNLDAGEKSGFKTGSAAPGRLAGDKALSMISDTPYIGKLVPSETAANASNKATIGSNIDKATNGLITEQNKFQYAPGGRGSVLALKTMLASKPGIEQPYQTNKNITAGIREKTMGYDLSESLAQQYKESNPYGTIDSTADKLDAALKNQYPLTTTKVDPKNPNGKIVVYNPENEQKIRQLIPDAVRNPQKYLGGQSASPEQSGEGRSSASGIQVGAIQKGYRFKGGNPADKNNWEATQ